MTGPIDPLSGQSIKVKGKATAVPYSPSPLGTRLSAGISAPPNYDTQLDPVQEGQFLLWKQMHAPNDSGEDYDLRGAFKAGFMPAANGHWPDTFKKPNHPSFSNESIYAPVDAPRWVGNKLIDKYGRVVFEERPQGKR